MWKAFALWGLVGGLLAWLSAGGCGPASLGANARPPFSVRVVATTTILADWARQVAGPEAQVQALLAAGADPHLFDPSPGEVAALAAADVVLLNGLGLEPWAENLLEAVGAARVVRLGEGVEPLAAEEGRAGEEGPYDPHFWMDPQRALLAVEAIRDALSTADPARAKAYEANAAGYAAQLRELHFWAQEQTSQLPPGRRLLVMDHDSFRYFAQRYGFQIVGAVMPGVTTEREPSAREVGELVEAIRRTGAPAVFLEPTSNRRLAESLAQEARVRVVSPLYGAFLGPQGSGAESYIGMMRHNIRTIVEALR